jgi:hypothetical protein
MKPSSEKIEKPEGEVYSTDDYTMYVLLICSGHYSRGFTPEDNKVVFHFDVEQVWPTVEAALNGKADQLMFKFSELWRAQTTWKMALRHISRRNIRVQSN